METATYDILEEVKGSPYAAMLDFCRHRGDHCSLVVRQQDAECAGIVKFLQTARPHLLYAERQEEWPGTQLSGETAMVYRYRLSEDLVALLKMHTRGLFDWDSTWSGGVELPEDLAIYRADGSLLLGSIARECEAWFELTTDEYREASCLPLKISKRGS